MHWIIFDSNLYKFFQLFSKFFNFFWLPTAYSFCEPTDIYSKIAEPYPSHLKSRSSHFQLQSWTSSNLPTTPTFFPHLQTTPPPHSPRHQHPSTPTPPTLTPPTPTLTPATHSLSPPTRIWFYPSPLPHLPKPSNPNTYCRLYQNPPINIHSLFPHLSHSWRPKNIFEGADWRWHKDLCVCVCVCVSVCLCVCVVEGDGEL